MSLNLADLFEAIVDAVPTRTALVDGDKRPTYCELDADANRLARHFVRAGVRPGEHVGLYMRNGNEFVRALLACLKIRAVPINIDFRYADAELAYLIGNVELAAMVLDGDLAGHAAAVLPRTPTVRHVVTVGEACDVAWKDVTVVDVDEATSGESAERGFAARSGDDLLIVYTAGAVGLPKAVMWRNEDFFHAALSGGSPFGAHHADGATVVSVVSSIPQMTWMLTGPFVHGAALQSMFSAFCLGATQVSMHGFDPVEALTLVERERVMTMTVVGDAGARALADAIAVYGSEFDLSSLFVVGSGGALFSHPVREHLTALLPNVIVRDNFGSSESGMDGEVTVGEDGTVRLTPTPAVRVVDEQLRPIEPGSGAVGYVARSGHVPLGYWGDPVKTAATFPVVDGVRVSILGDMARVEGDGTIILLGRRGSVSGGVGGRGRRPSNGRGVQAPRGAAEANVAHVSPV
ncbi:AMP-binding protein [Rhodococcus rhodochrous]|uniref:AMP-binding protein n=1 Tax=Rhodococcus rhodochrous TaxID=1829 RepID=A0AAW4XA47_RHORH|nr:AMP-binding protein [Rhodococcus rhodochrous]MCD2109939.1 AMP-binding protein [Rhodococcus rhodochrous]QHG84135.1 acyl-CoA synthetase [Rhodococcus rhodochrous]QOH56121.1 acyl-CoA synthetase [Rhodococcus rhodochrous]